MIHTTDIDITSKQVAELASLDALVGFLAKLGYDTGVRTPLTPESLGLMGESAGSFKKIELLSEDPEQFLRVVFAQPKSLTAKSRNDLARVLGRSNIDHLLIFASDFDTLEFVLLDKRKREARGPVAIDRIQVTLKTVSLNRRNPTRLDLRTLRRFTWTCRDGLEQYDKLRSVFDAAVFTGEYFQNRALFADYFLRDRLKDDAAWRENPSGMFEFVRDLLRNAQADVSGKDKDALRKSLLEPLFKKLGFKSNVNRPSKTEQTQPDYLLKDANGTVISAAFVYSWDRWLDGPDLNDQDTPEENPGACVVTALDQGTANWLIVTNGKLWRLYSRQAHARATNFYEVDLVEALSASGDTDPNEAFRYWWLFFRPEAFRSESKVSVCWLDTILQGSRDYAKRLGDRLKDRIFLTIFPHLSQGFLEDRTQRLGLKTEPGEEELTDIFEATLTLLYRLLFLLYAESRDLLPVHEAPYFAASLKKIKEDIAEKAGVAEADVSDRLKKVYSTTDTAFYDRMERLFLAMDKGDPVLNVPTYNGGLFNTTPDKSDRREQHIACFLMKHKVPDRYLAMAIDRLSRDQDERTLALGFIDYKSLEVRHLGSIYEGLLEFKLKVAQEDLTTQRDKNSEKYVPLSQAKAKRGRQADVVVCKKGVYLSNDKAERKATGSYYTPDPIVEPIVANTVGPVLEAKLEKLRSDFRKVRKTFENELQKAHTYPPAEVRSGKIDHRQWAGLQTYNHHKELVERLFDLKVLDPAMGSAHFLVEVVDFVTDRLLNFLNQFPINPVSFALDVTRTRILESLGEQGVTVDPVKLTDINLLKRHVLKRCIYGVDINPMAVELAKVSLWLDCFTLGAPLNFLDHHLRCGNSLIGATFKDLENATKATATRAAAMFGIDYEPLLRAIHNVLIVSKMSDATAAEVATSVDQYQQARQELSGYKIVLDLLLSKSFGLPKAAGIVEQGGGVDLTSRENLLKSLDDDAERNLVQKVEALANRSDRRFFHWDIEFPEVFFGFSDVQQRRIAHKNTIEDGTAGFDCVVGNPPYDVLSVKDLGPNTAEVISYFRSSDYFSDALGRKLNLYRLFMSAALNLLHRNGRVGVIVPLGIAGDLSAKGLRERLFRGRHLVELIAFPQKDDPSRRVFRDAKLSTTILLLSNRPNDTFRLQIYPEDRMCCPACDTTLTWSMVKQFSPESLALPLGDQHTIDILQLIYLDRTVLPLGSVTNCYQGEVNLSTYKGCLTTNPSDADLLKGVEIGRYGRRKEVRQGEKQYVREKAMGLTGDRSCHCKLPRVVMQGITGVDDRRRLQATKLLPPCYCGHSVNYFVACGPYSMPAFVVLLNSALYEWRFRLTSTNNNVNSYEVHALPLPAHPDEVQLPTGFPFTVTLDNAAETARSMLNSFPDGSSAWERMCVIHAFLTAYGELRLQIGESDGQAVVEADHEVDVLIWAAFGVRKGAIPRYVRALAEGDD